MMMMRKIKKFVNYSESTFCATSPPSLFCRIAKLSESKYAAYIYLLAPSHCSTYANTYKGKKCFFTSENEKMEMKTKRKKKRTSFTQKHTNFTLMVWCMQPILVYVLLHVCLWLFLCNLSSFLTSYLKEILQTKCCYAQRGKNSNHAIWSKVFFHLIPLLVPLSLVSSKRNYDKCTCFRENHFHSDFIHSSQSACVSRYACIRALLSGVVSECRFFFVRTRALKTHITFEIILVWRAHSSAKCGV